MARAKRHYNPRTHLAHHASVSQERILIQICKGLSAMATVAFQSHEALWIDFIERVKSVLGTREMGRKIRDAAKSYQLREPSVPYGDHFGGKNEEMGVENAYFWNTNPE